jgi:hypothetical protein
METFLGMEVQQNETSIKLHLDHDILETLAEYKKYIKNAPHQARPDISWRYIVERRYPQSAQANFLHIIRGQAPFCSCMPVDPVRNFFRGIAAGEILCIRGSCAVGGASPHLEGFMSMQIACRRRQGPDNLVSGIALGKQRIPRINMRTCDAVHQSSEHLALEVAEDYGQSTVQHQRRKRKSSIIR